MPHLASLTERAKSRARGLRHRRLRLEPLEGRMLLSANPIISEILADNENGQEDVDGQRNDWIEILNAGDAPANLDGWYLTDEDSVGDGTGAPVLKWQFPAVELGAGEYLIVFASGKDRDDPLAELHTNFRLDADGEYLALVDPAGVAVSAFAPNFPPQVADVAYGIPTDEVTTELIAAGAAARVHIPTDDSLDPTDPGAPTGSWLDPTFDDTGAGWFDATTGIGFAGDVNPPLVVVADSVAEISGTQGQDNWRYGVWSHQASDPGPYTPSDDDFLELPPSFWDGTQWTLEGNGVPTKITATGGHPTGTNSAAGIHWSVRRWEAEVDDEVEISVSLADDDPAGDGAIGRIFHNDTEIYTQPIDDDSFDFTLNVTVATGDTIDFVIDPGAANNDAGDATTYTVEIRGPGVVEPTELADSIDDWSFTGTQGENDWSYGYYDKSADGDNSYADADFQLFPQNDWTGTLWDWTNGNPPWTSIAQQGIHSSDHNPGPLHWAIRRWESTISGTLTVTWRLAKTNTNGDGVTGHVFHNGVEVDAATIAGNDTVGVERTVVISGVQVGDRIDFAHDPTGVGGDPDAPADGSDGSNLSATIGGTPSLADDIATDIETQMRGVGTSAYIRIPFTVADPSALDKLLLKMKYDDGFVAYINGHAVADRAAPAEPAFDSTATVERGLLDAITFETINISGGLSLLNVGANLLMIHALNFSLDDGELLALPELVGAELHLDTEHARYFVDPTPGAANGFGTTEVGPLVVDSAHAPNVPNTTDPLLVTAQVAETFAAVDSVTLHYRSMYAAEQTMPMVDDGAGGDLVAGDGVYSATLPAGLAQAGEMIRWYVTTEDVDSRTGRFPTFTDAFESEQYRGTIAADAAIVSDLPVIHWFVQNPTAANDRAGTRGSLFYDGEFYDNVQFDLHGQSSSGFPKKSYDVDFTRDHRFRLNDDVRRMKDFDLLTNYADKSKLRNTLAYEIRAATGSAYHLAFPVRIEQNGQFFGVYDFVEDGDDRWLDRIGLDGDGAMYKMYNGLTDTGGGEKKTRKDEGSADLQALIDGVNLAGQAQIDYIMDNVNVPAMANYLAGFAVTSNRDCCHKNYYAYRDTNGNGEWWYLPWDVDLSLGRNWGGFGLGYHDYTIYADNLLYTGLNNALIAALINNVPGFDDMYLTRVRTLFDELYGPPGQAYEDRYLESRADYWAAQIGDVAANPPDGTGDGPADHDKWGQVSSASPYQPFETWPEAVAKLKDEYLEPRRQYYVDTLLPTLPGGQLEQLTLLDETNQATAIVPSDASFGDTWQQIGFDDSLWLSGADGVGYERGSGYDGWIGLDILPAIDTNSDGTNENNSFYARYRFNVTDPAALQSLTLQMRFDDGFVAYLNGSEVKRANFEGTPSWNSPSDITSPEATNFVNYSITEHLGLLQMGENILAIQGLNANTTSSDMLAQPRLTATPVGAEPTTDIQFGTIEFNPASGNQDEEFIELFNNATEPVDISGWQLAGGIDHTFQPGTVLPAGFHMYVSPNVNAFRARTSGPSGGQGLFIQGDYGGHLSNFSETIQLVDDQGSLVVDTTYIGDPSDAQLHLRVAEVMYNPYPATVEEQTAGYVDNDLFEYIELQNTSGDVTLDLTDVRLTDGVTFDFTGSAVTSLAPGQRVLVVRNTAAFELRYADLLPLPVAGFYTGGLQNGGEQIKLEDAENSTIQQFTYNDAGDWPGRADGNGSSLEAVDTAGNYDDPANWRSSSEYGGSPGSVGIGPRSDVVVNEVLSNSDAPGLDDAIELLNTTAGDIDLGGWVLSDSSANYRKYEFPPGTTIHAGEYLVLTEADFNPAVPDPGQTPFALDGAGGDDVWLLETDDTTGGLVSFVDHVDFGAAAADVSFGRWPDGTGRLYPMAERTFGSANTGPRIGPAVIGEVMYSPTEPTAGELASVPALLASDFEFVELFNPSPEVLDIGGWRLDNAVDFVFPPGTTLRPGDALVVLPFDPINDTARLALWQARYPAGSTDALFGPSTGRLNNAGETLQLERPDAPSGDPPVAPWVLVDEVRYEPTTPWPAADATGASLDRTASSAFGNDGASWTAAAAPTPGVSTLTFTSAVVGRHVFYNHSAFDATSDDDAVATDKTALRPGQTATSANYTNFAAGINGLMIDVAQLPNDGTLLTDTDFAFSIGNDNTPSGWTPIASPTPVVRLDEGADGGDRIVLTWPNETIRDTWLQVTVRATAATGLAVDEVFYFGNAIGETGNDPTNALVTAADLIAIRDNPRGLANRADVANMHDVDRDAQVNATDALLARNHATGPFDALRMINP